MKISRDRRSGGHPANLPWSLRPLKTLQALGLNMTFAWKFGPLWVKSDRNRANSGRSRKQLWSSSFRIRAEFGRPRANFVDVGQVRAGFTNLGRKSVDSGRVWSIPGLGWRQLGRVRAKVGGRIRAKCGRFRVHVWSSLANLGPKSVEIHPNLGAFGPRPNSAEPVSVSGRNWLSVEIDTDLDGFGPSQTKVGDRSESLHNSGCGTLAELCSALRKTGGARPGNAVPLLTGGQCPSRATLPVLVSTTTMASFSAMA